MFVDVPSPMAVDPHNTELNDNDSDADGATSTGMRVLVIHRMNSTSVVN